MTLNDLENAHGFNIFMHFYNNVTSPSITALDFKDSICYVYKIEFKSWFPSAFGK
jgi:hypothetical protein